MDSATKPQELSGPIARALERHQFKDWGELASIEVCVENCSGIEAVRVGFICNTVKLYQLY